MDTPWGSSDFVDEIRPGVLFVSTPSHGGFMVSPEGMKGFSAALRLASKYGGRCGSYTCFEEDCEAAAVLLELLDQGFYNEKERAPQRENLISNLSHFYPAYLATYQAETKRGI